MRAYIFNPRDNAFLKVNGPDGNSATQGSIAQIAKASSTDDSGVCSPQFTIQYSTGIKSKSTMLTGTDRNWYQSGQTIWSDVTVRGRFF